MNKPVLIGAVSVLLLLNCSQTTTETSALAQNTESSPIPSKSAYWKDGKAEICVYDLKQNRYQDLHPGHAVHVFVPEDFLTDKLVKNESYTNPNSTSILKNIHLRKFNTGVYDYSVSTSVFTAWDQKKHPHSLKVTSSSQEWCGTTFLQLKNKDNQYQVESRSYFESEGDENFNVAEATLEDELFNLIRIDPKQLPTGDFKIIPSMQYMQLRHQKAMPVAAAGTYEPQSKREYVYDEPLSRYILTFPSMDRRVEIFFEEAYPHKIIGWDDEYKSYDGKKRTTKAWLKKDKKLAYWNNSRLSDSELRKELGLP